MTSLLISHRDCERHVMLEHHPESPARLRSILDAVQNHRWDVAPVHREAREIDADQFNGIHPDHYLDMLSELYPGDGIVRLDADTSLNRHSLRAARLAAGGALQAVEAVLSGEADNAFCAVRPPGHHAESALAMGFCIL